MECEEVEREMGRLSGIGNGGSFCSRESVNLNAATQKGSKGSLSRALRQMQ
jgi:hypothetical protein